MGTNCARSRAGLWVVAALATALAACGGAQRDDGINASEHARALEDALRSGKAVDRDLFAAPVLIEATQDWESLSSARQDDGPVYYKVFGRLFGGRLHVDELHVEQVAVDKVLRADTAGNATSNPAGGYMGEGYTLPGLPPEFGFWLALSDLYRQSEVEDVAKVTRRGFGATKHAQTSKAQGFEASDGKRSDLAATRDLVEFRASPDVVCAGQFKVFQIDEKQYVSPADEAEARLLQEERRRKSDNERREALGLGTRAKGQMMWQLQAEPQGRGWTLRIHVAHDAEIARSKGEVLDQSLLCRSSAPLLATELPGYRRRVTSTGEGTFKVLVWRGGAAPAAK